MKFLAKTRRKRRRQEERGKLRGDVGSLFKLLDRIIKLSGMKFGDKYLSRMAYIKPKYAIIISVFIALLMIVSSVIEYIGNRNEVYLLIGENAVSLIKTVSLSSENTIISDREIEALLSRHLLGVGRNAARIDSITQLSNDLVKAIAEENDVYRINVFDRDGNKVYSSGEDSSHITGKPKYSPKEFIKPILEGKEDEIIIGLKESRFEEGTRFAVAVRRPIKRGGAIVVNLDAESFLEFRERTGFGKMIQDIGDKEEVEYVILQTPDEIIAANKVIKDTGTINDDAFLKKVFADTSIMTREYEYDGKRIFEVAKRFQIDEEIIGVFRIGLHTEEIDSLNNRLIRRAVITSIVIIVISITVLLIIISGQNYRLISGEYSRIQTFTGTILNNMSLAVISADENNTIKIFNKAGENLFGLKAENIISRRADDIFKGEIKDIIVNRKELSDTEIVTTEQGGANKILLVNAYNNYDSEGNLFAYTMVIKDITDIKKLEEQTRQNEKLVAMGELASAVAHEVRNPLNTINMISQRFDRESERLGINNNDLMTMNKILRSESERVNKIIQQFLIFARPPKLNITETNSASFLYEIKNLFGIEIKEKKIDFEVEIKTEKRLNIDVDQFKQVLMNLLINASDAVGREGNIKLSFSSKNGKNIFEVSDNGQGIPDDVMKKIFDLYYTTKTKGTGLGLSIVRQIVNLHGGTITAESEINNGTKFTIELNEN